MSLIAGMVERVNMIVGGQHAVTAVDNKARTVAASRSSAAPADELNAVTCEGTGTWIRRGDGARCAGRAFTGTPIAANRSKTVGTVAVTQEVNMMASACVAWRDGALSGDLYWRVRGLRQGGVSKSEDKHGSRAAPGWVQLTRS